MRNIFINNYKRKKFQNTILDTTDNQYYLNSGSMQADTITSEINEKDIHAAIDGLKGDFRIPFTMFLEGFHYDEIAAELNIPMGTVKSRIFHARKKLAGELSAFRN